MSTEPTKRRYILVDTDVPKSETGGGFRQRYYGTRGWDDSVRRAGPFESESAAKAKLTPFLSLWPERYVVRPVKRCSRPSEEATERRWIIVNTAASSPWQKETRYRGARWSASIRGAEPFASMAEANAVAATLLAQTPDQFVVRPVKPPRANAHNDTYRALIEAIRAATHCRSETSTLYHIEGVMAAYAATASERDQLRTKFTQAERLNTLLLADHAALRHQLGCPDGESELEGLRRVMEPRAPDIACIQDYARMRKMLVQPRDTVLSDALASLLVELHQLRGKSEQNAQLEAKLAQTNLNLESSVRVTSNCIEALGLDRDKVGGPLDRTWQEQAEHASAKLAAAIGELRHSAAYRLRKMDNVRTAINCPATANPEDWAKRVASENESRGQRLGALRRAIGNLPLSNAAALLHPAVVADDAAETTWQRSAESPGGAPQPGQDALPPEPVPQAAQAPAEPAAAPEEPTKGATWWSKEPTATPATFRACGLEWQNLPMIESTETMTWNEATAYAAALDLDGVGWRLPTTAELKALYLVMPLPHCGWFWSSEHDYDHFFLGVTCGKVFSFGKQGGVNGGGLVRCVRTIDCVPYAVFGDMKRVLKE